MPNTKQLTGAVALLASIAVLDNFIFVEFQPGFESMALIEPIASVSDSEIAQTNDSPKPQNEVQGFWIDRDKVSRADFASFLESTGYELQKVALITQIFANQNGDFAAVADNDKWRAQTGKANWTEPSDEGSLPLKHTLAGQDDLKVDFKDALAYCNWLGKDLPTVEQVEHIAKASHDKNASHLSEFRCVKNN